MSIQSAPKVKLLDMVRTRKLTEPYEFEIEGSETDAKNFVHRMRVELGRFREKIRDAGRTPKQFKMLVMGYAHSEKAGRTKITLVLARSTNDVSEELKDAFSVMAEE